MLSIANPSRKCARLETDFKIPPALRQIAPQATNCRGKTLFKGESLLSHTQWSNQIAVGAFTKIMHYEHEQRTGKHPPTHYFFFSMTSNRQRRPHLICRGKNVIHKIFYGSDLVPLTKNKDIMILKFKNIYSASARTKKTKIAVKSTLD